jgi:hypothetical protein
MITIENAASALSKAIRAGQRPRASPVSAATATMSDDARALTYGTNHNRFGRNDHPVAGLSPAMEIVSASNSISAPHAT